MRIIPVIISENAFFLERFFARIGFCVIELFNLKDPMRLMQKTYLIPVQIGMPLSNASKIYRIYGYCTLSNYW
jgi:hypothetical protein